MRWSRWHGFAALTLATSVGLAWSQSPRAPRQAVTTDRILTVHENGKAIRCRIVQSWRTQSGALAHQLQVLETGEMMTIIEDGQPVPIAGSSMQQQRLRIFHWGQRGTTPPGAPVPPLIVDTPQVGVPTNQPVATVSGGAAANTVPVAAVSTPNAGSTGNQSSSTKAPASNHVAPATPAAAPSAPSAGAGSSSAAPCLSPCPTGAAQGPACRDRIITWEENCAKPSGSAVGSSVVSQPIVVSEKIVTVQPTPAEPSRPGMFPRRPADSDRDSRLVTVYDSKGNPILVRESELKTLPAKTPTETGTVVHAAPTAPTTTSSTPTNAGLTTNISKTVVPDDKTPKNTGTRGGGFFQRTPPQSADLKANVAKRDEKSPPTQLPPPSLTAAKDEAKKETAKTTPTANKSDEKRPFSTATLPAPKAPAAANVGKAGDTAKDSVAANDAARPGAAKSAVPESKAMWSKSGDNRLEPPGQATIEKEKVIAKKTDILLSPERLNPDNDKVNPKTTPAVAGVLPGATGTVPTPLGVGSVLAASNGVRGPVQYVPVPVATVPDPIRPPVPPEPRLPEPPNPTAYLNAFTPPPNAAQQQAMMQQAMMQRMQAANTAQLVPVHHGPPLTVSYPANYTGPQPPANPFSQPQRPAWPQQPIQPVAGLHASAQQSVPATLAQTPTNETVNLAQLVNVLQNSPYPAQREWAAANLATFDWRVYPHLTYVLAQSARQDQVAAVRATAVYSLSRLNVHSDTVLATLATLRHDADPRVRYEVEQAYVRMGLADPQR